MFSIEASVGSESASPSAMEPRACLGQPFLLIITMSEAGGPVARRPGESASLVRALLRCWRGLPAR